MPVWYSIVFGVCSISTAMLAVASALRRAQDRFGSPRAWATLGTTLAALALWTGSTAGR